MIVAPPHPREEARLHALADAQLLDTPPEAMFDDVVRLASYICEVPIALISLVDRDRQWFKARVGIDADESSRDVAFCAHAILDDSGMMQVEDARDDPRFADNPFVTGEPWVRFYAGVPLTIGDDDLPIGTLCAIDRKPRRLTPEQTEAMHALARQVVRNLEIGKAARRTVALNDELQRAATAQQASEARLRALVVANPDGMLRVARDGTVLDRKVARDRAIMPDPQHMLGRHVADCLPPRLARLFVQQLERTLASGAVHTLEIQELVDGQPCDKELRFVASGPDEALALIRDVTERKLGERAKDAFIATVSHELRTPVTSIRGSLSLLEHGMVGPLPEEALEMVRISRTNTERLLLVINDILDLEKLSAGQLDLSLRPVEPARVMKTAAESIRGMAAQAGVEVVVGDCAGAPVLADEARVIQVLNNLLSNAIKFSPRGARVDLSAEPGACGRLRLCVTDRGPGIAPEHHARVFERFHQVDASDSRERGGTGLGLAIVKSIVEEHGGVVGLDSAPGRGSKFWFELPCAGAAVKP
ncbi:GAF domain-containing sensor histidine kinase [Nannocystis bainbridge]|uniref:histidine kinase n=1 Tax=Nannocystis bainbridge TaxID=2995303 RepID=A0ABT5E7A8_9BACT|nr:ATP-binding protein [Nannocystis bainbridge]MDC0721209.1 ATP-binding protein [Nannocystis bainbridge]